MHLNSFIVTISNAVFVVILVLLFIKSTRKSTGKHTISIITLGQLLALLSIVLRLVANCFFVYDAKSLFSISISLFLIVFLQYLKKKDGDKSK
jgi:hypothetical protein